MRKSFGDYEYLAGRRGVNGSLWEAKDHLLYVERKGFFISMTEQYRRFDFDKIEAIAAAKSKAGVVWNVVYGCLLGVMGLMAVLSGLSENWVGLGIFGGLSLLVAIILGANLKAGATCRLTVTTAVNAHAVGAVRRWKDAQRVIARVEKLVGVEEGEEPNREVLDSLVAGASQPVVQPHAAVPIPTSDAEILPWSGRRVTWLAGSLVALTGSLFLGELLVSHILYTSALLFAGLAAFVFVLIALAKTLRRAAPVGLTVVLSVAIALLVLSGIMGYGMVLVSAFTESMDDPQIGSDILEFLKIIAGINYEDLAGFAPVVAGVAVLNFLSGLVVMGMLLRNPKAKEVAEPVE